MQGFAICPFWGGSKDRFWGAYDDGDLPVFVVFFGGHPANPPQNGFQHFENLHRVGAKFFFQMSPPIKFSRCSMTVLGNILQ